METYVPSGETVRQFHLSDDEFRVLMGPFGSGKTTACCYEHFLRAIETPPDRNGVRKSRVAVIRNRISDLESTTIKSWNEIFEGMFGKVRGTASGGGFVAKWKFGIPDGTVVSTEARFFPYDGQSDIKRLLGAEYTYAFLNEVRELPQSLMTILPGRLRYPKVNSLADGYDEPWHGIFSDTNPPNLGHWIHRSFEQGDTPQGWQMFRQPAGVIRRGGDWVPNPKADNAQNLRKSYYVTAIAGQPEDVIRVNYANEYGYIKAGKLIVPNFSDNLHVSKDRLEVDPEIDVVYVGLDFGSTPAAIVGQESANGQWRIIRELISLQKPGIAEFGHEVLLPLKRDLETKGHTVVFTGDPAGGGTSQNDGDNCFNILLGMGIDCQPAYTNAIGIRAEVVDSLCRQLVGGEPRILLCPSCSTTIQGFAQKYVYLALNKADDERDIRYANQPRKDGNAFSHSCDAAGYCIMGSGYGSDFTLDRVKGRTGPIDYQNRYVA